VARLEPEPGELTGGLGNLERIVVVVVPAVPGRDEAVRLELVQQLRLDPRVLDEFRARQAYVGTVRPERLHTGLVRPAEDHPRRRRGRKCPTRKLRRLEALVECVEVLLDHPQRQIVVTLRGQHEPQPFDVVVVELAIARRSSLRFHQAFRLEEPDLRDRDVGKLGPQPREHLTDGKTVGPRRRRATH
jgi:hypothetical protein